MKITYVACCLLPAIVIAEVAATYTNFTVLPSTLKTSSSSSHGLSTSCTGTTVQINSTVSSTEGASLTSGIPTNNASSTSTKRSATESTFTSLPTGPKYTLSIPTTPCDTLGANSTASAPTNTRGTSTFTTSTTSHTSFTASTGTYSASVSTADVSISTSISSMLLSLSFSTTYYKQSTIQSFSTAWPSTMLSLTDIGTLPEGSASKFATSSIFPADTSNMESFPTFRPSSASMKGSTVTLVPTGPLTTTGVSYTTCRSVITIPSVSVTMPTGISYTGTCTTQVRFNTTSSSHDSSMLTTTRLCTPCSSIVTKTLSLSSFISYPSRTNTTAADLTSTVWTTSASIPSLPPTFITSTLPTNYSTPIYTSDKPSTPCSSGHLRK